MEYARHLLEEIGLGADRLEMFEIAASDAPKWVEAVQEMSGRARALGPNPLRLRPGEPKAEGASTCEITSQAMANRP